MRILGLDYGDKTIGVAVSDDLGLYAHDLEIIRRRDEGELSKSIRRLAELAAEYKAAAIVLGFPKHMDNSEGERCQKTLEFKARLERSVKIPIYLWDERLTTVEANRHIAARGARKRNEIVDKVAAVFILQGYLDYIKKGGAYHEQ
ncbi:MAG: Holliday junction resolvase RuvX [Clostridiales bacterium]|jgi:putative Holliday junction resolvase|nr:Holliday junction resolvase RuvX [Clostridiales bacterium]